ncbi:alpha/beta hydrolase [Nocardia stercoris]|uniref:Alpha/beta hydrolase n=2 Tax=Nocardia stercoris TaxID=2483361 RepID=A0A3M2L3Q5_9NOCA|nr:alpha/beta hydrolase [Nocardia stercoris]
MAIVAGALAVGMTALVVDTPALFLGTGLAVAVALCFLLSWWGFRLAGLHRAKSGAVVSSSVIAVAITALAAATILRPFPAQPESAVPASVQYWDLPTGSRIAYVHTPAAAGHPPNPPVVFVHGGPGTPGEGIPVGGGELAAQGFDVYAYDQVGAGRSTRLGDVTEYTVGRQVADLDAIRQQLGAEQLVLVGRSWGGSLTAQYIAAHPDRVAKAVFVAPGAIWPKAFPAGVGEPWHDMDPAQQARYDELMDSPRVLVQSLLMGLNPNAAHAFVPDAEADSWMHEVALTGRDGTSCSHQVTTPPHNNPQGFYVNQMTTADFDSVPDPRPTLATARVPVLVMAAQCDFLRWPVTREYRDVFPDAMLVDIHGAGHGVSADQPEIYTRLLESFLGDRPLPLPAYTAQDPPPGRWTR